MLAAGSDVTSISDLSILASLKKPLTLISFIAWMVGIWSIMSIYDPKRRRRTYAQMIKNSVLLATYVTRVSQFFPDML